MWTTTGSTDTDLERSQPTGTAFFMNVHGIPDGYGIGRMRVTYWVSFRDQV